jgi:3-dehydroquinate dehydratase type I
MPAQLTTPPWVVGTIRPEGLRDLVASLPQRWALLPDLIEVRLDLGAVVPGRSHPDPTPFFPLCAELEAARAPVLVTLRLVADGGRWTGDAARLPWFERAGEVASWLDIEVQSTIAPAVVASAHAAGRRVIVSHHDFSGTPDAATLDRLARQGEALGADIVKVATRVDTLADHAVLVDFAHRMRGAARAIAIVGMGPLGTSLRSYLPCIGSRLTYGFLDDVAAPGQIAAAELMGRLVTDCPAYAASRRSRA